MEVAGGVLSIVSLLIQLIDKVNELREYWRSFRDAPQQVAAIIEDLGHLKDLLSDRANSLPVPSKSLLIVIARFERKIGPLESLIEELEPGFRSRHRVVRYWSAYKTTKKTTQLDNFQVALHDAKTDLILANQQISE